MTNSNPYKGILGLDLDGVVADTTILRVYERNNIPLPITNYIDLKFDGFEVVNFPGKLSKHDVLGLLPDAIVMLCDLIHRCNLDVVVVSSWASPSQPLVYKGVYQLFQKVFPSLREEQWVGQTSGGGGSYRETAFFNFIRDHYTHDDPRIVLAIDDSSDRHFPTLKNLIAPCGRTGFCVDDYIKATQILEYDECFGWRSWANGYWGEPERDDKEELWNRIFQERR